MKLPFLKPGHCLIIAEAGVNHNGNADLAYTLIDAAADAGADMVKFQLFNPDELAIEEAPLAEYQKKGKSAASQHQMLSALTLKQEEYAKLSQYAKKKGITFLATPFDIDSAKFLKTLDVPTLKIPSGEITNIPFLTELSTLGLPVIISTGMSTVEEVKAAVEPFAKKKIPYALLHCVSSYPTPMDQVHLRAMEVLRKNFDVPVGFSDHTDGALVSLAAVACGAQIIEKHFTTDRSLPGPDHSSSLEPDELKKMINDIRMIESALGKAEKVCQPCEENVKSVARRSIVAAKEIPAETALTADMLAMRRPGTGMSPALLTSILGKRTKKAVVKGSLLTRDALEA